MCLCESCDAVSKHAHPFGHMLEQKEYKVNIFDVISRQLHRFLQIHIYSVFDASVKF